MSHVIAIACVASAAASYVLTAAIRRIAIAHDFLDHPNERSSHSMPTPRGGGTAIVVAFHACLILLWATSAITNDLFVGLVGSGGMVAAVGAIDDRRGLPASVRAVVHGVAAGWALVWMRNGNLFDAGFGGACDVLVTAVEWVGLVWMINLYNFMDGIDGLAGGEACAVGLVMAALLPNNTPIAVLSLTLATSSIGFLMWNWPKATIFMGDVGSGFLGLVLGVLALANTSSSTREVWPWIIVLGAFEVDSTWTLLRRLVRGKKVTQAHRSHAYQHAARRWGGHLKVTLAVLAIDLFWLGPWAFVASRDLLPGYIAALVALVPLLVLTVLLGAGTD